MHGATAIKFMELDVALIGFHSGSSDTEYENILEQDFLFLIIIIRENALYTALIMSCHFPVEVSWNFCHVAFHLTWLIQVKNSEKSLQSRGLAISLNIYS
jgi:hypothetical protein